MSRETGTSRRWSAAASSNLPAPTSSNTRTQASGATQPRPRLAGCVPAGNAGGEGLPERASTLTARDVLPTSAALLAAAPADYALPTMVALRGRRANEHGRRFTPGNYVELSGSTGA